MPTEFPDTVDRLAALVPDGATVAVGCGDGPDVPMAIVRALVRRRARGLHLITVPTCAFPASGMTADLLIGAGCVDSVETSGISLGEIGPAPCFTRAVKAGRLRVLDSTCPAIYAAIQAGAKGQPFASLRGLLGSDLLRRRSDYAVIANPFAPDDPVVVLKAINPRVAILHAPYADRRGNVWVGRCRASVDIARAADRVLVTVDEIVDRDLFDDEREAAGTIPAFYVAAVVRSPGGSLPMRLDGSTDVDTIAVYAREARTEAGFLAWVEAHVSGEGRRSATPAARVAIPHG